MTHSLLRAGENSSVPPIVDHADGAAEILDASKQRRERIREILDEKPELMNLDGVVAAQRIAWTIAGRHRPDLIHAIEVAWPQNADGMHVSQLARQIGDALETVDLPKADIDSSDPNDAKLQGFLRDLDRLENRAVQNQMLYRKVQALRVEALAFRPSQFVRAEDNLRLSLNKIERKLQKKGS